MNPLPPIAPIVPIRRPAPLDDPAWAAELKLDGFRGIGDTINGRMLSKNLNPLKRFQHLLDGLPLDCVFDGEFCALDDGRPQFNDLLFGRGDPVYIPFDLLFYEREDIRSLPLKERRSILDQVAKRYGLQKSELFIGCGKSLYKTVCDMDLEGVVCKRLEDHYGPDVRWWKVLNENYSQKQNRHELFQRRYG
jgi:bifunctional non-homologous end joining protein LigD